MQPPSMVFLSILISELVLLNITADKHYDHCWQQNKTMLLCDDVIINVVLVIKRVRKFI